MAGRILSSVEAENIQHTLYDGKACFEDAYYAINNFIKLFSDNEIVQTFFAAGNFGKEEQDKIVRLESIIDREFQNLNDKLFPMTDTYLEGQKNLNERGEL